MIDNTQAPYLNCLGRGGAFDSTHTAAFFETDTDLVFIDCSMLHVQTIIKMESLKTKDVYICVTHTHGDHVSGIGTLIYYCYYVLGKYVHVITPSEEIFDRVIVMLEYVEHIKEDLLRIYLFESTYWYDDEQDWLLGKIKTVYNENDEPIHEYVSLGLTSGKLALVIGGSSTYKTTTTYDNHSCGYIFNINGKKVIYTGDTNSIEPFKPHITENVILYVEATTKKSPVHLNIDESLEYLIEISSNNEVFLMHIDDFESINEKIKNTNIKIVEIYGGC